MSDHRITDKQAAKLRALLEAHKAEPPQLTGDLSRTAAVLCIKAYEALPALLDEREAMRERIAELEALLREVTVCLTGELLGRIRAALGEENK